MCSPSAPAPDPVATAQAQNQVNKDALMTAAQLNQINQVNPTGSISYSGDVGSPDRTQTTTLNPQLQQILTGLQGAGVKVAGQIPTTPFDFSHLAGGADPSKLSTPQATSYDQGGALQYGIPSAGGVQTSLGNAGPIQQGVNTDFDSQLNSSRNAAYNSQAQYLDPRFARQDSALSSQLAAQGIPVGSEAYNNAMAQESESKNQAYQGAQDSATLAGNQLQNQLFGQNLSAGQFGNTAQQQNFNQLESQGNFANGAQAQLFGQNAAGSAFNNATAGQANAQNMGAAQFANSGNTAAFNQTQALRNQGINEQQLSNNLPINELMSLLNGTSISNVNFQPFSQSTAAQGSPDAVGLAASNYNTASQNQSSILGSIFGAAGKVGAAAVPFCWVAREVYGENDPRWLKIREWMLTKAPESLREFYLRHGERIAAHINDNAEALNALRSDMDGVLAYV